MAGDQSGDAVVAEARCLHRHPVLVAGNRKHGVIDASRIHVPDLPLRIAPVSRIDHEVLVAIVAAGQRRDTVLAAHLHVIRHVAFEVIDQFLRQIVMMDVDYH